MWKELNNFMLVFLNQHSDYIIYFLVANSRRPTGAILNTKTLKIEKSRDKT